ncbi:MAG: hypothetical protein ACK44E_02930 [Anaerolineales bacterium]
MSKLEILSDQQYPQILDNTLNLVLPYRQESEMAFHIRKLSQSVDADLSRKLSIFSFRHPFNGMFLTFQIPI